MSFIPIINTSFVEGIFPISWKRAIVTPLLKKPSLENIMKNYGPVSNLSFLATLVEKASLISFQQHIEGNNLLPSYQSAYRCNYSTETLLLKISNDILMNFENQNLTPLVAIDLSAAFDTVNQCLLLQVLNQCYGVCNNALKWVTPYLEDRSFQVSINESNSSPMNINFSVPQGSINGPIYFTFYSSTLQTCIPPGIHLVGYADDHTIYIYPLYTISIYMDTGLDTLSRNRLLSIRYLRH